MDHPSPKVRIKYVRSPECRHILVTGAWGGVSPTGDVQVGFYQDLLDEPPPSIRDQDQKTEEFEKPVSFVEATRLIHTIAVMRPETALQIAKWLTEHAEKAEEAW